jgi:hypothetical protein
VRVGGGGGKEGVNPKHIPCTGDRTYYGAGMCARMRVHLSARTKYRPVVSRLRTTRSASDPGELRPECGGELPPEEMPPAPAPASETGAGLVVPVPVPDPPPPALTTDTSTSPFTMM